MTDTSGTADAALGVVSVPVDQPDRYREGFEKARETAAEITRLTAENAWMREALTAAEPLLRPDYPMTAQVFRHLLASLDGDKP